MFFFWWNTPAQKEFKQYFGVSHRFWGLPQKSPRTKIRMIMLARAQKASRDWGGQRARYQKHGSEPKTFACAVSWLFFFLGFFFLLFVLAVCAAVAVTAAIVAVFAAVAAVPLTRREHPRESQEARARRVLSLASSCSRALRRTTTVVSLLSWLVPLRGALPPDRCRREGRAEAKASRGFEPRSLDSGSRVLTVTPRGRC